MEMTQIRRSSVVRVTPVFRGTLASCYWDLRVGGATMTTQIVINGFPINNLLICNAKKYDELMIIFLTSHLTISKYLIRMTRCDLERDLKRQSDFRTLVSFYNDVYMIKELC